MANEHENSKNYTKYEHNALGNIQIADEVLAVIAGIACTEVEGVTAMNGNITREFISKLGMKSLSKGVHIAVENGVVTVDLDVILEYGVSIPEVTANIQERVKTAIEINAGLKVDAVNIHVSDVSVEEE